MINHGDVLTLDDNKQYAVVYKTEYNNKKYVYLIDQDDFTNTMFCECNDDDLEEVTEPEIIEQLLKKYQEKLNQ